MVRHGLNVATIVALMAALYLLATGKLTNFIKLATTGPKPAGK